MTDVKLITSNLIDEIKRLTEPAEHLYWIVAFAMESGVRLVLPHLKRASENGAEIKVLVGDYLHITQPQALDLLITELPNAEIRLYESKGLSFHPKAYLFKTNDQFHVIVGSSNLSKSAMEKGVEWSLYAPSKVDTTLFEAAVGEFMKQFLSSNTIALNEETLEVYKAKYEATNAQTSFSSRWLQHEEVEMMYGEANEQEVLLDPPSNYQTTAGNLTPRPAQKLALQALEDTRAEEYDKAMAVLATGLGKTYLAAFFAKDYPKVLFIAHREEILEQAKASFQHVYPNRTIGIFNGQTKEKDAEIVFASVYTLAADYHLQQFDPTSFDLVVVDEFHHAAAPTYERILAYFKPKFLLGITATPDRLDNKDVYSICDGNVAISIHFLEAIRQNWLAPFKYYGVLDETDYSNLKWYGKGYDEEELLRLQLREEYAQAILEAWEAKKQTRTIGFCSSIKQAIFLSEYFNQAGYRTIALHGQSKRDTRLSARKQLENEKLEAIFTVDLFNEGVDIPTVDTLLFARPTESLAIFTQQIGRGLRLAEGKSHCVIIDLIGNYRNADRKLLTFSETGEMPKAFDSTAFNLPESCHFDLELAVVNLLNEMKRKRSPRKQQLVNAFLQLKLDLGRRPSYLEFHLKAEADAHAIRQEFGSYPAFLSYAKELTDVEEEAFVTYAEWFKEVSKTSMTKIYKMVVLLSMLSKGTDSWLDPITPEEIAPFFHHYLTAKDYRIRADFSDKRGRELRDYNEKKIIALLKQMPLTKWSGSSKGLITFENNDFTIHIKPNKAYAELVYQWTKETCLYRLHQYFERKGK